MFIKIFEAGKKVLCLQIKLLPGKHFCAELLTQHFLLEKMVRQVAKYSHGVPFNILDWIATEKITRTLQLLQSTV